MKKQAIIIGAGPAGLTAAYELLERTDVKPIILEKSDYIGGISRTINYKGNRMDMGPHRFFSKSDRVMDWWLNVMPLKDGLTAETNISYQNKTRTIRPENDSVKDPDKVMLIIQRLTRIYFLRKFFAYPIQLSLDTLRTLGFVRTIKILFSFLWIRLFPRKPEKSLEDFIINKFGNQLYLLFFKDYTEKVWGITPSQISAEWGAQRIKGVSLSKAIAHAVSSIMKRKGGAIGQKATETSLIEQFLYPKYGPGSLWEEVARQVKEKGGEIYLYQDVKQINSQAGVISSIETVDSLTGETRVWDGDYFFSTMPVQELIAGMGGIVPDDVRQVAAGLQYRDFINVGILLKHLSAIGKDGAYEKLELKDNWIYIQERDVKVGRLMIYNNWGDGMIRDPETTWIGMEYFCNKTDALWAQSDEAIQGIAVKELEKMGLARVEDVLDITVARMEKTYPAYFGTYERFDVIKKYTDKFANLFLVGRNGMHKYNNADHSMLTAMVAVDNIAAGVTEKANLWAVNTEQEYHEEKHKNAVGKQVTNPSNMKEPAGFKEYLLNNRLNRIFLYTAGIAILIQFVIFKLLYPYAGFINGDSYVYLQSAAFNLDINTYPVGYSKFLRLFSAFTKSDTALVGVQYLSLQLSALYFMFTLFRIYKPRELTKWVIFSSIVLNPVFLYLSNYVSSDSIFIALSLLWFGTLLTIIHQPRPRLLVIHVIVLLLAFTVRYNALYYPVLSIMTFLLSRQSIRLKFIGIASTLLVVGSFMLYTSNQYKDYVGIRQFTPFTGWQLANNALYAYRFVDSSHRKPAPAEFAALDKVVRTYFDTTRDVQKHPTEMLLASTMYMWDPGSPLHRYMDAQYSKDDSITNPFQKRWAKISPLLGSYASYLIRQYPRQYLKYYLWPNTEKFYTPPGEFLDLYNGGIDSVYPIAQVWFNFKSKKVTTAFRNNNVTVLEFLPIQSGIMNAVFLIGLLCYLSLNKFSNKKRTEWSTVLLLAITFWLLNFVFSVFAAPITLRYQVFPIIIVTVFGFLLLDYIVGMAFNSQLKKAPTINKFVAQ